MSMKYRIRNMKSGKIVAPIQLELSYNYLMGTDGMVYDDEFFPMPNHKAEIEVADGVYEGDYLLIYTDMNPLIAQVVIREGLPALNGFSSHWVPIYLPINLILTNDYEVIQCR